ncbi:MAG: sugar porter family MFS transporter [Bacteroidales bacterium]|nr:sugar porter family MFS transporter [Bacteroidales bacterium]
MKRNLILYTFVAALGGLLFGFDTAVVNGAIPFFSDYFDLSDAMKGWAVSSALIGCIIGALVIGWPGDRFGRRDTLKVLGLLFLISAVGSGLANNLTQFVIYRLIGGLAVGGASVLSPMYISEIAPPKHRGRLTITFQLAIVIGILTAFFSDYLLINTGDNNWRWMFISESLPAVTFMVLLFAVSKSPRWLVKTGDEEQARIVLERVNSSVDADKTIAEIHDSLSKEGKEYRRQLLKAPYFKLVLIGMVVGMFNQFTGINVIMYYATDIFRMAGFSTDSSIGQTVIVGLANLIFTLIAMRVIDHLGRKKMLLVGSLGMPVFLLLFAWSFFTGNIGGFSLVIMLVGFTAFFAFSQGAVIWVILSEMFPNVIRARATAIASFSLWFFNGLTSFLFPFVVGSLGGTRGIGYVFVFYAIMTFSSFFFFRKFLFETKGKSLEELEKESLGNAKASLSA